MSEIINDPFYADVTRVFGEELLFDAGFVRNAPGADASENVHSPWPLCTPMHKLAASEDEVAPMVLLSTGCYSPPHNGHLAMLDRARSALISRGYVVAGGYLSPSHDDYVGIKNGGVAALSAAHRLRLCQAATADNEYWMVCPWEARWVGTALNFTDVITRLQKYLRAHWHPRTEVVYVFGADNAGFARTFVERGRCVIIPRAGSSERVNAVIADPLMREAVASGRVLVADDNWASAESSSAARATGDGVPAAVAAELSSWRLDWSHISAAARPDTAAGPDIVYALRDDLQWASTHWRPRIDVGLLDEALATFRKGLIEALGNAFASASWPDRPQTMTAQIYEVEAQQTQVRELMSAHRVLSLDLCSPAHYQMHLCREFGLADGQLHSQQLLARPGYPSLADQLQAIDSKGPVVVVDDDVASGFTFASTRLLLESRGIACERTISLLDETQSRPHDVVDARDFLVGARDSGLVVRLSSGELTRAPYLLPWVSLSARAKIPPSAEWALNTRLWQLNIEFFSGLELLVMDAHSSSHALLRAAGAVGGERMVNFCVREYERTQKLPFTELKIVSANATATAGAPTAPIVKRSQRRRTVHA